MFSSQLQANFISIVKAAENDYAVIFDIEGSYIKNKNIEVVIQTAMYNNLFVVGDDVEGTKLYTINLKWPDGYGHLNKKNA